MVQAQIKEADNTPYRGGVPHDVAEKIEALTRYASTRLEAEVEFAAMTGDSIPFELVELRSTVRDLQFYAKHGRFEP